MGLKKANYTIEKLGLTLPEAYAVIKGFKTLGDTWTAEFAIQASRENALALEPLEKIYVTFPFNRAENPCITAYRHAKSEVTVERGGRTTTIKMPFHGWTDDIHTV